MSDTFQELADIPKVRLAPAHMLIPILGQSLNVTSTFANFMSYRTLSAMACNSSTAALSVSFSPPSTQLRLDSICPWIFLDGLTTSAADKREFLKISQAVGTYHQCSSF